MLILASFPHNVVLHLWILRIYSWLAPAVSNSQLKPWRGWLCSRWNSGYRHHVWERFIPIYHRECTFDFGMQVCKVFPTDHLPHFFPIPLKGFWSEDRQKIWFASFLKQIKSATYLPKEPSGRDDLELFEEILNASINLSLTFFSRATANWKCG